MVEPAWESWLSDRFAGYLLYDAAGAPRDPAHVARALERLSGTPGAWNRLAALGFLLDPVGETASFVTLGVPSWLRRVLPTTVRRTEESHGRVRGRTDWSRTLQLRMQTRDPTRFVGIVPERTFETPGAIVIRWLLEEILRAIAGFRSGDLAGARGWLQSLSEMQSSASRALAHAALRDIPVRHPTPDERQQCAQSHDPVLRQAARVFGFWSELLPSPRGDALQRTVERFALAPADENKRFELFTLLAVVEALDRLFAGWKRVDDLVAPDRDSVASWTDGETSVRVAYDQGTPAGIHADAMKHYLGLQASARPDLRLIWERDGVERELYLDAKNSTVPRYMNDSHLKMLAYIADRPAVFDENGPKVIITTPHPVVGTWRPEDPVAFVDPEGCVGGALEALLGVWVGRESGLQMGVA